MVVCSSWVELFAVTWFWFRWVGAQVGQLVFPSWGMGTRGSGTLPASEILPNLKNGIAVILHKKHVQVVGSGFVIPLNVKR